ncbi:MAG: LysR family transcriptional regulator [Clostridia bacterium]|nr:LysR family transcriptional regulator [Clostridia bacterium]
MTLQQIYYALVISECGSMNKASEKLYISQPTLTSAIKALEAELQISLFLRTRKGVELTGEGAEFLMYARQVYLQYEMLQERYGEKEQRKQKFAVSAQHYSFATEAFVNTVKQFSGKHYEFAIRETTTYQVIHDVGISRSEIGILYLSDFNRKAITKLFRENDLEFHHLVECNAYVFLWKGHPLAQKDSITFDELCQYPCLSFEQGEQGALYLEEEILGEMEYPYVIKANDRATMLNLAAGLNGYTLCSGITSQELNGTDYCMIPFCADELHPNSTMEIGYIMRKHSVPSKVATAYIQQLAIVLRSTSA